MVLVCVVDVILVIVVVVVECGQCGKCCSRENRGGCGDHVCCEEFHCCGNHNSNGVDGVLNLLLLIMEEIIS